MDLILFSIISLIIVLIIYKLIKLKNEKPSSSTNKKRKLKTMILLGSGGHTTEMLNLIQNLDHEKYSPLTFIITDSDKFSLIKLEQSKIYRNHIENNVDKIEIKFIKRSRQVGQNYFTSIFTTLNSFSQSIRICFIMKPDLFLCNGPATSVPICFALKFFNLIFTSKKTIIIYIESFCRVNSISLSAKLIYYIVDCLLVQWPELIEKFPRCKYIGSLV